MHTNVIANNRKLLQFATANSNTGKNDYFRHASSCNVAYIYINFQQIRVSRSVKTMLTKSLQIITSCIKLQLPIVNFEKSIIPNMHHHITYMYINFQQIRVSKSVQTVHTNIFTNNRELHKFATTNSIF